MARSPATPDKANTEAPEHSSKVALPSIDKINSASMIQQASVHEPSPASTYGETAGSRSVPATPQEYRTTSKSQTLLFKFLIPQRFAAMTSLALGSMLLFLHNALAPLECRHSNYRVVPRTPCSSLLHIARAGDESLSLLDIYSSLYFDEPS